MQVAIGGVIGLLGDQAAIAVEGDATDAAIARKVRIRKVGGRMSRFNFLVEGCDGKQMANKVVSFPFGVVL